MLQRGCDPNDGFPLREAIRWHGVTTGTVLILLKFGSDPFSKGVIEYGNMRHPDKRMRDAIQIAQEHGHDRLIEDIRGVSLLLALCSAYQSRSGRNSPLRTLGIENLRLMKPMLYSAVLAKYFETEEHDCEQEEEE